jgi:hypothetical protein
VHSRLPLAWHEQLTLLGLYLSRPEPLSPAWRNQRTVLGLAFARSASLSHRPHRRCGTGIWPDRDIAARRRHMTAPRPSLPTALPAPPRTPAGKARVLDVGGEYPARHGLSAGGKWIRTFSPTREESGRAAISRSELAISRNVARAAGLEDFGRVCIGGQGPAALARAARTLSAAEVLARYVRYAAQRTLRPGIFDAPPGPTRRQC